MRLGYGILFDVMDNKVIMYIVLLVAVLGAAIWGLWHLDKQAAPKRDAYAGLAECLSEKDIIFYGAYWCPACAEQKVMFEGAAKKLPYLECSPDGRGTQIDECIDAGIDNYPVWEFNGNYRCSGITSPEVLAHIAGCQLPTYDDIDNTPGALYERLVVTKSRESLKKRGIAADKIDEFITTTREGIDTYLTENHQTTVDTVQDSAHLLAAMAETLYNCAPYEKPPEETESEGIEIQMTPEGTTESEEVEIELVPETGGGAAEGGE